jgi:hypothetical protein
MTQTTATNERGDFRAGGAMIGAGAFQYVCSIAGTGGATGVPPRASGGGTGGTDINGAGGAPLATSAGAGFA